MAGKGQGPAIGIDLGTCYSCVAVWKHNRVEIIPNDLENRKTPSYVAFNETHRLIGHAAMDRVAMNPTNTVFGEFLVLCYRYEFYIKKFGCLFYAYMGSVIAAEGERIWNFFLKWCFVFFHDNNLVGIMFK
jgi:hypothetical protein